MNVKEDPKSRLEYLERRLSALEDERDILRILTTYGPLVDGGEASAAADLYLPGGFLDVEGHARQIAPNDIVAGLDGEAQRTMNAAGCMHMVGAPRIDIEGDRAAAITYNLVVLNRGTAFEIWRAAVNRWQFVRTDKGWKVVERYSNAVDGSTRARSLMLGEGTPPLGS